MKMFRFFIYVLLLILVFFMCNAILFRIQEPFWNKEMMWWAVVYYLFFVVVIVSAVAAFFGMYFKKKWSIDILKILSVITFFIGFSSLCLRGYVYFYKGYHFLNLSVLFINLFLLFLGILYFFILSKRDILK